MIQLFRHYDSSFRNHQPMIRCGEAKTSSQLKKLFFMDFVSGNLGWIESNLRADVFQERAKS